MKLFCSVACDVVSLGFLFSTSQLVEHLNVDVGKHQRSYLSFVYCRETGTLSSVHENPWG